MKKMRGLVYVRGEDDAFGVGQISDITSGTQKHGVAAEYILRERLSVTSEIYQDVDKEADETRTVAEARLQQSSRTRVITSVSEPRRMIWHLVRNNQTS